MIISIHVPKTAGISLLRGWEAMYPNRVLRDYGNEFASKQDVFRDANEVEVNQSLLAQRYDVVHGHFAGDKYRAFKNGTWVIFLRDPVDRIVSLHEQWRRRMARGRSLPSSEDEDMVRIVEEDQAQVVEFARRVSGPNGAYAKFVGRDGLGRFEVIGITERYEESLRVLQDRTGLSLRSHTANASEPTALKSFVSETSSVAFELRELLEPDYVLYEEAVNRFNHLLRGVSS